MYIFHTRTCLVPRLLLSTTSKLQLDRGGLGTRTTNPWDEHQLNYNYIANQVLAYNTNSVYFTYILKMNCICLRGGVIREEGYSTQLGWGKAANGVVVQDIRYDNGEGPRASLHALPYHAWVCM